MLWAIIPARSRSKGLKNKNIQKLGNSELVAHSIKFAKKLKFVDYIFVSTNSKKYKKIAENYGANVPFLRSSINSSDKSMEEDVLFEIAEKCKKNKMKLPKEILWLRPTHPLRCLRSFKNAYKIFKKKKKSTLIVTKTDSRIFLLKKKKLCPIVKKFYKESMIRRQDSPESVKMFHGEFFKFPRTYKKNFLGRQINYVIQPAVCSVDIDTQNDLTYLNFIIKKIKNIKKFLHAK